MSTWLVLCTFFSGWWNLVLRWDSEGQAAAGYCCALCAVLLMEFVLFYAYCGLMCVPHMYMYCKVPESSIPEITDVIWVQLISILFGGLCGLKNMCLAQPFFHPHNNLAVDDWPQVTLFALRLSRANLPVLSPSKPYTTVTPSSAFVMHLP